MCRVYLPLNLGETMHPVVREPDLEVCFSLPGPLSALLIQCHELLQIADRRWSATRTPDRG